MAAVMADKVRTIGAGSRLAIRRAVIRGTMSNHRDMLNLELSTSEYTAMLSLCSPPCNSPRTRKMTRVMSIEGTVVSII